MLGHWTRAGHWSMLGHWLMAGNLCIAGHWSTIEFLKFPYHCQLCTCEYPYPLPYPYHCHIIASFALRVSFCTVSFCKFSFVHLCFATLFSTKHVWKNAKRTKLSENIEFPKLSFPKRLWKRQFWGKIDLGKTGFPKTCFQKNLVFQKLVFQNRSFPKLFFYFQKLVFQKLVSQKLVFQRLVSKNWFSKDWFSKDWFPNNWFSQNWFSKEWFFNNWFPKNWFPKNWFSNNWFPKNWFPISCSCESLRYWSLLHVLISMSFLYNLLQKKWINSCQNFEFHDPQEKWIPRPISHAQALYKVLCTMQEFHKHSNLWKDIGPFWNPTTSSSAASKNIMGVFRPSVTFLTIHMLFSNLNDISFPHI